MTNSATTSSFLPFWFHKTTCPGRYSDKVCLLLLFYLPSLPQSMSYLQKLFHIQSLHARKCECCAFISLPWKAMESRMHPNEQKAKGVRNQTCTRRMQVLFIVYMHRNSFNSSGTKFCYNEMFYNMVLLNIVASMCAEIGILFRKGNVNLENYSFHERLQKPFHLVKFVIYMLFWQARRLDFTAMRSDIGLSNNSFSDWI